jgi:predicted ATPase
VTGLDGSILGHIKDPQEYPEVTYLGNVFGRIKIYRHLNLGNVWDLFITSARFPQKTDLETDFLREDGLNLALVLNSLDNIDSVRRTVTERLRQFLGSVERVSTKIHGGTIEFFLHEEGLSGPTPATRLSQGTLRFLCLLAILCHPTPPPLICIEEPEIGLHPDALSIVAELLVEASQRTQLVVTTHSDVLVSALSDVPQSIIVCERRSDGTRLRRLESAKLKKWLNEYSLGELWRMGELGGD